MTEGRLRAIELSIARSEGRLLRENPTSRKTQKQRERLKNMRDMIHEIRRLWALLPTHVSPAQTLNERAEAVEETVRAITTMARSR